MGCLKKDGLNCLELCVLGVEDCSTNPPKCEYGYFLFTLGSSNTKPPECV